MSERMKNIDAALVSLRQMVASCIATAADEAVPPVPPLGQYVRQKRKALGWTLEDLARQADTTKSHIWAIENDRAPNPTVQMVDKLARALGVPLIHMCAAALRGEEWEPPHA